MTSKSTDSQLQKDAQNGRIQSAKDRRKAARRGVVRITGFTLASNVVLTIVKGVAGIFSGSAALVSDAANSASDVLYGIIVLVGVRFAGREADAKHPYGYERFESLVSMFIGAIVTLTGLFIGFDGLQKVWLGATYGIDAPDPIVLWVAAAAIAFKVFMYLFTKSRAKKYGSDVLAAAAADHGSDALATGGVFIGIATAQLGIPIMDPLASLVIAALILRTGIDIIAKSVAQLTDQSAGPEFDQEIREIILAHKEVVRVDKIMSRVFGDRIYLDIEIRLPGDYTLDRAHDIATKIHFEIEESIPKVKHCMVHINPSEDHEVGPA
jgi:cation diffusion facilitator family transporter